MGFWIQGWIEVTTFEEGERDEHSWQSIINLGTLIDVADEVSEQLFGLSKRCVTREYDAKSQMAGRGLPIYLSKSARQEIEEIREHEQKYGAGEFGGYTYASWAELKQVNIDLSIPDRSDWNLVFNLLQRLEEDYRFNENRLRVVVWYVW